MNRSILLKSTVLNGLIFALCTGVFVLSPPYIDDYWMYLSQLNQAKTGVNSSIFETNNAFAIQGQWLGAVLGATTHLGLGFEGLRIFSLLSVLGGWLVVSATVSRLSQEQDFSIRIFAGVLYVAGVGTLLTTNRYEVFTSFLVALFFASFWSYIRTLSNGTAVVAALTAVVAASLHQSGFVLFLPTLWLAIFQLRNVRNREKPNIRSFVEFWLTMILIFAYLTFSFLGPEQWLSALGKWQSVESHAFSNGEITRWSSLFDDEPIWRWWLFVIAMGSVAIVVSGFERLSRSERVMFLSLVSSPAGLLLTGSKWTWHLGALVPILVLLVVFSLIVIRRMRSRDNTRAIAVSIIAFFGALSTLSAMWVFRRRSFWWQFPFREYNYWSFLDSLGPSTWTAVSLGLASLVLIPIFIASKRNSMRTLAAITVSGLITLPISYYYFVLGANTVKSDKWTVGAQNIANLSGNKSCGLGDELSIGEELVFRIDGDLSLRRERFEALSQREIFAVDSQAKLNFNSNRPTAIWVKRNEKTDISFALVASEDARIVDKGVVSSIGAIDWAKISIPVDKAVYLDFSSTPAKAFPISLRGPAELGAEESLARLVGADELLVSPYIAPYFPCNSGGLLPEGGRFLPKNFMIQTDQGTPFPNTFRDSDEWVEVSRIDGRWGTYVSVLAR